MWVCGFFLAAFLWRENNPHKITTNEHWFRSFFLFCSFSHFDSIHIGMNTHSLLFVIHMHNHENGQFWQIISRAKLRLNFVCLGYAQAMFAIDDTYKSADFLSIYSHSRTHVRTNSEHWTPPCELIVWTLFVDHLSRIFLPEMGSFVSKFDCWCCCCCCWLLLFHRQYFSLTLSVFCVLYFSQLSSSSSSLLLSLSLWLSSKVFCKNKNEHNTTNSSTFFLSCILFAAEFFNVFIYYYWLVCCFECE